MTDATGFWSYVHHDDDAEGGRITRIATDLTAQYEMVTGESIRIFHDRSHVEWGDKWRSEVDSALASIVFFIPVLTPRYFQSAECRREFNSFARRARQLGVREVVMPILYINFPALETDPPPDELMEIAKSFQWEDWTELRFESPESTRYRTAIARMAERLSRASLVVEKVDATTIVDDSDLDDDDSPGFVDRLARAEEAMSEWVATLGEIQAHILAIGEITTDAAERISVAESRGMGLAGRLEVFRQLSENLDPSADGIQELSNSFVSQMNDIDSGVHAILEKAAEEMQDAPDPELVRQLGEFLDQIRDLAKSADSGLGALLTLVETIASVENQSRNLRPVLRKLRRGFTVLLDGRDVINSWVSSVEKFLTLHLG